MLTGAELKSLPPLMSGSANRKYLESSARSAHNINLLLVKHLERTLALPEGTFTELHSMGDPPTSSHLSITITPPAQNGDARRAFNAHTDHGSVRNAPRS